MPDGRELTTVKVLGAIAEAPAEEWNACAGFDNPFVGHEFLAALEESGSARAETGWRPQHLVVEDPSGRIIAAAPLYAKSHSYGEYVFDWGWAEAYERAGGRYYPKLLSAVPFTPVTGPRLLVRPGAEPALANALASAMVELAERYGLSSLHINFPTEGEWRALGSLGFLLRTGQQFHWENKGYQSFDDFLAELAARKRKAIRKERRAVRDQEGLRIRTLVGADIEERHWDAFFAFYINTSERKWGSPYLTRAFFPLLHRGLADRCVLVLAERDGRPVAGALNVLGSETLYGRYWGCVEDHRFLHFEACYYRAIDFAIARGLKRVEAGAQGAEHKVRRGYRPRLTYSAHWIADAALREPVADFLARERVAVENDMAAWAERSPFREGG